MSQWSRSCLAILVKAAKAERNSPDQVAAGSLLFLYPKWYRAQRRTLHQAATVAGSDCTREQCSESGQIRDSDPPGVVTHQVSTSKGASFEPRKSPSDDGEPPRQSTATTVPALRSKPIEDTQKLHDRNLLSTTSHQPGNIGEGRSSKHENQSSQPKIHWDSRAETIPDLTRDFSHEIRRLGTSSDGGNEETNYIPWTGSRRLLKQRYKPGTKTVKQTFALLKCELGATLNDSGQALRLDEEALFELTGGYGENVWRYNVGSGCEVHMLPRSTNDKSGQRTVLIRGEQAAREMVKARLENECQIQRPLGDASKLSGQSVSTFRLQRSQVKHHLRTRWTVPVVQIPRPKKWSLRSFADHIEDLTTARIPRTMRWELNKNPMTHIQVVAQCLETLFTDPDLLQFLSVRALNYGLSFVSKHKALGKTLDTLTNSAKNAGLSYTVETFNILVQNALQLNDVQSAQNLLREMKSMQIVPGPSTWATVLKAAQTLKVRYEIVDYMITHDLVQSSEARDEVAVAMIQLAIPRLKDHPENFLKLEESLEKVVGQDWATTEVINRLLKICIDKRLWDLSSQIIDLALRKEVILRPGTLIFVFQLFQRGNRLRESLELFHSLSARAIGVDDSSVIPLLFLTAWKRRSYNVCRVLWHYAASRAIISLSMQNLISSSLVMGVDQINENSREVRRKLNSKIIAKVIPGTDLNIEGFDVRFPRLTAKFGSLDPIRCLCHWTPDDGTRDEQLSLAYTIMLRDLNAWKRYRPMDRKQLFELLEVASRQDSEFQFLHESSRIDMMKLHQEKIPIQLNLLDDSDDVESESITSDSGSLNADAGGRI